MSGGPSDASILIGKKPINGEIEIEDYDILDSGHLKAISEDGKEYLFSPGSRYYLKGDSLAFREKGVSSR